VLDFWPDILCKG